MRGHEDTVHVNFETVLVFAQKMTPAAGAGLRIGPDIKSAVDGWLSGSYVGRYSWDMALAWAA